MLWVKQNISLLTFLKVDVISDVRNRVLSLKTSVASLFEGKYAGTLLTHNRSHVRHRPTHCHLCQACKYIQLSYQKTQALQCATVSRWNIIKHRCVIERKHFRQQTKNSNNATFCSVLLCIHVDHSVSKMSSGLEALWQMSKISNLVTLKDKSNCSFFNTIAHIDPTMEYVYMKPHQKTN